MAPHNDELLSILQAHGQQFLDSFTLPELVTSRKRKRTNEAEYGMTMPPAQPEDCEDEEWAGITDILQEEKFSSDSADDDDFDQGDDAFTADSSTQQRNVVVFSDITARSTSSSRERKAQMKAFMSSKVSKIQEDILNISKRGKPDADEDDECTNAQNDALLHRLVHTKLLSGSLNQELDMTPAQRRKALAGRILELAGGAKLGRGEQMVREAERNKAAKRVREGIVDKRKEREKQRLEEAKNLGNYHPTIKKLFESSGPSSKKKRDRGLKMGVGKFNGGFLRLSREEINLAAGGGTGGGRGKSGSHSRGRGSSRKK